MTIPIKIIKPYIMHLNSLKLKPPKNIIIGTISTKYESYSITLIEAKDK